MDRLAIVLYVMQFASVQAEMYLASYDPCGSNNMGRVAADDKSEFMLPSDGQWMERKVKPVKHYVYHYNVKPPKKIKHEVITHVIQPGTKPRPHYDHMSQILFRHPALPYHRSAFPLMYPELLLHGMNIRRSNDDNYKIPPDPSFYFYPYYEAPYDSYRR